MLSWASKDGSHIVDGSLHHPSDGPSDRTQTELDHFNSLPAGALLSDLSSLMDLAHRSPSLAVDSVCPFSTIRHPNVPYRHLNGLRPLP